MVVQSAEGRVLRRLRRFGTVVFDCDATLSAVEGIDILARRHAQQIEQLTDAAMRGEVPLERVYGRRLELVRPEREQLGALGQRYIAELVPDAAEVVRALRAERIEVRIMSGGLRPAVLVLGQALGLAAHQVAAVDLSFDADGHYRSFDEASPLTRAGGKRELLNIWRQELKGPVMFVGDGATDLEARDVADLFVAYAGVVARSAVMAGADVVVRSSSLAPVLALALAGQTPRLPEHRALLEKGLHLLDDEYHAYLPKPERAHA
ncbi:MAG: HAD-IB family phosphatase [Gemmatimonadetes bacterium]|nr:HAD-IB family phosphatase [Gemmatimonadota bacterium]